MNSWFEKLYWYSSFIWFYVEIFLAQKCKQGLLCSSFNRFLYASIFKDFRLSLEILQVFWKVLTKTAFQWICYRRNSLAEACKSSNSSLVSQVIVILLICIAGDAQLKGGLCVSEWAGLVNFFNIEEGGKL